MLIEPEKAQATPLDYVARVNRAIDYIVNHLDRSLALKDVAPVATFSPFHFHRVFRALVGETLHQFIKRLRLERALSVMSHDPQRSLTDVALDCGFSSSSDFSRCFKQRWGIPPSAFDIKTFRARNREAMQAILSCQENRYQVDGRQDAGPNDFAVEIRDLPARSVAYIRVLDPYNGSGVVEAAQRLITWADEQGVGEAQWLGYMWDDLEVVALKDCRYDVGVEVNDFTPVGEIGRFDFPAMRVAQVVVRGGIELEIRALKWLFGTWLPQSGYVPDDQPCFEAWIGRPFAHGFEHFELLAQLPVKRG